MFLKKNLISFFTIVNKELTRILRIWPQTVLPSVITIVLYYIIFGDLIGKKIGELFCYSYIQYIVPGLIMMSVINSSYSNVVASFFSARFQRNIEELLVSPTYNSVIILGYVFGGVLRATIVCFFVVCISVLFARFYFYNFYYMILVVFSTSVLFSLAGLLNGIFAKKIDDISIVPTFILTPLIYLSGIFYTINMLPSSFKYFVYLNPIFYVVNIFRYVILGISEADFNVSFFMVIILIIFLYLFCWYLLRIGYNIKK
ncbi:MAG TPA: ABC transporter permease [Candidatus Azoamicus sp. OHIO1]